VNDKTLAVFESYKIRRHYDEENEIWYFSVVDIIAALTQQPDYQAARNYWKVLKNRLNKEGSETVTKCNRLKMVAEDGKIAKGARLELESKTGRSVITGGNYLPPARKPKQITKT
jgi:hypothetical protein